MPRPPLPSVPTAARAARRALLLAALLAAAPALRAQAILVAPQGVVLDARTRAGSVELYNPGERPSEVTLSTVYGYPVSTAEGEITLRIVERPDSTDNSAAGFVDAFPRRLVLQPGQRQTVRLLARPPQGLAAGEYWARLVVAAREAGERPAVDTTGDGVRIGLSLEVRTIIAVNYRVGTLRTGVTLGTPEVATTADSVIVRVPMQRTGSAAWIGSTTVRLADAAGTTRAEQQLQTAVYTALSPRWAFARSALPAGPLTVTVRASSDRPDVVQATHLRAAPATVDAPVVLR